VVLRFGHVEIDEDRFEIRVTGHVLRMEPRVYDFIRYLARHHGRVITKQELLRELWGESHVGEAVLARCACIARRLLGDAALISTVPRRGYSWVAEPAEKRGEPDTRRAAP
jgi:DNA-binding winged helix-turn-helix (wHTH) protein